ncbi:hypothetical protein MMC10_002865 [Thelotrema lepadinum]|nr:hypothetical protein [Thelotrema lepadinum]
MMNKYRSSEDGNFILVSSSLKEIVQDPQVSQLSPGLSQEEIRCLQCLTSDYRGGKDRNMQRVSGTCEWVLKHPNFCHWNRDETKLLWISADPGCGKSVLSRALIDEKLVTTNPGTASICYFFFKDDDPSRQTAANALSAILHQLFVQKPRLLPYAMHHFQHHGKHLNTMFDPLWDILKAAANDSESAEIICVIDALDESEEAAAEQLISKLGRYYSPIKGQDIKLRFLITSRPYFSIETVFHNAFDNVATISLRGEDESEKISKEIDLVIHNRIPEICRARRYPLEEKEQNILISTLKQTPNRTYLWLHLIFAVVQKSLESTGTGLKKLINKIPLSVDDAYEKILRKTEKSEDAGQAKQLLHMIVAAYRPLTLQEMNIAWALHEKLEANEECRSFQDLDLPSQEHFKTKIRNVCGLFVNVVGQKIYLLHQTAKEFLVAQKLSSSLRTPIQSEFKFWKNSVSLIEANSILTRICVFYLLFSEIDQATDEFPEDRLSKSERSASQRLRRRAESKQRQNCHFYGLLDYAGSHWVDHFQVAQRQADEAMLGAALELCDTQSNRFRRWYRLHRPDAAYNVEFWCRTSGTNLTATAHLGLHEVMKEMLKRHGINVNIRDKINRTPLHWAAARGYGNVVGQLLERDDIETNAQDDHGLTALLLASWQGQIDPDLDGDPLLVNNLIRYPADSMGLPLGTTSEECADVLRLLLAKNGIDVNACDHQKWTPLIAAASRGYTDIVGQLLEKDNVQVNFQGTGGMTALSWAAYRGYRKVVMQLLKVDGIKINIQDGWGMSPLSLAAIEGHVDVVKELLKADGIAINIQDNDGMSPLSYATNKDYTVVVKELLKADGITINIQDNHGMSPLSWAAWRSHLEVVRQLLADGRIDVEIKDMKSRTALDWARVESHNEVVQLLETAAEHQAKRRRLR